MARIATAVTTGSSAKADCAQGHFKDWDEQPVSVVLSGIIKNEHQAAGQPSVF